MDQKGGIMDQKGGIKVHSPRIKDDKPECRDQQFFLGFRDQAGCTIFVGSGTKICHGFGIKGKKFGYKTWDHR